MKPIKNIEDTLSSRMNQLLKEGYTLDFNRLTDDDQENKFKEDIQKSNFTINHVYRFDGMTNVDDESILYAIETKSGLKGTLVDAYGVDADTELTSLISKMAYDASN